MVEALGHKLATHHPVIEPVSVTEPGRDGRAKAVLSPGRDQPRDARRAKNREHGRNLGAVPNCAIAQPLMVSGSEQMFTFVLFFRNDSLTSA